MTRSPVPVLWNPSLCSTMPKCLFWDMFSTPFPRHPVPMGTATGGMAMGDMGYGRYGYSNYGYGESEKKEDGAQHLESRGGIWMTAFTDLHCHILPGLDDGPKDWAATWDMIETAVRSNVGQIVCTPHCRLSDPRLLERSQRIGELAEVLNRALAKRQIPLQVFPGAELLWGGKPVRSFCPAGTDACGNALFACGVPLWGERLSRMEYAARCVEDAGFLPVLAHPERYGAGAERPWLPGGMVWQRLGSSARQRERAGGISAPLPFVQPPGLWNMGLPCGFQRRPQWGEPYAKFSAAGESSEGTLFPRFTRSF